MLDKNEIYFYVLNGLTCLHTNNEADVLIMG